MIYVFSFQLQVRDLEKLFILLVFGFFLWFSWKLWKEEKGGLRLSLALGLSAVFLLILYSMFIVPLRSYNWARKQLEDGQYYEIEGQVSNYHPSPSKAIWGHTWESFTIDGTEFVFSGTENYGYSVFQCDGGVLHEGQWLRIRYVEDPYYHERRICYIEEIPGKE